MTQLPQGRPGSSGGRAPIHRFPFSKTFSGLSFHERSIEVLPLNGSDTWRPDARGFSCFKSLLYSEKRRDEVAHGNATALGHHLLLQSAWL